MRIPLYASGFGHLELCTVVNNDRLRRVCLFLQPALIRALV